MTFGEKDEDAYLLLKFQQDFLQKKGAEFENWFAALAGHAYGTDFEKVRNYGSDGDFKCDGRRKSTGTIFQCYAPDAVRQGETITKIDSDFSGALAHWPDFMNVWAFVHNDLRGLPPKVIQHLDILERNHPKISIEIWDHPQLEKLFYDLSANSKRTLFGPAPNLTTANNMTLADLKPVIDILERLELEIDESPLSIPTDKKLEKNKLSPPVKALIQTGRLKEHLVKKYFLEGVFVDLGERIAEAFRAKYLEYKEQGMMPDQIFWRMQLHAGSAGEPKRQIAGMTVLAYFFDRCDIFENPDGEVPDQ